MSTTRARHQVFSIRRERAGSVASRSRRAAQLAWVALFLAAAIAGADGETPAAAWKFDVIFSRNGAVFRGLIVEETPALVRFQNVRRHPGRPTVVFSTTFTRGEVLRIERLADADRDLLKSRLRDLDAS